MGRFETETLRRKANLTALTDLSGRWIDAVHTRRPANMIILEIDSSASPTHGNLEGTTYNGQSALPANRHTAPAATGRRDGDSRAPPNSRARRDR